MRFLLGTAVFTFAFLVLFRVVFAVLFWNHGAESDITFGEAFGATVLGAKFDLRLASVMLLPQLFLSWIPLLDPTRHKLARRAWIAAQVVAWAGVVLIYMIDFEHYEYMQTRVDASVVEHLAAPAIALEMVWDSYPLLPLIAGLGVLIAAYAFVLTRLGKCTLGLEIEPQSRKRRGLAFFLLFLLLGGGVYGKFDYYPLRWSEAYGSQSPYVVALGLNPVLQIADTWEHRQRTFDIDLVREHYDEVATYLGVDEPDAESLNFRRHVPARDLKGAKQPNIVIVICESFAAFKAGCLGNTLNPTPRFDAMAAEGLLFDRFFVPSGPTARSVFSVVTSVPDVNLTDTASRNPMMINQRPVMNELKDYKKFYFLGGSANWGNIRGVLEHNIEGLNLREEGSYDAPRSDVWGISDLDLVRAANATFREQTEPFFAIVQTSGNHRPWTIPEDHGDFEVVSGIDDQVLRDAGFPELIDHYNAVRFLDYSIGEMVELARKEDYFRDTIFMFFGDHGTSFPASTAVMPGLTRHNVPFLVYSPARLGPAQRIHTIASSIDVVPTAVGLTGTAYINDTLGRDLFDTSRERPPYAFVRFGDDAGLVGPEHYVRFLPGGTMQLFEHQSDHADEDVVDRFPEEAQRLGNLAQGLFETASFLLYRDNVPAF